MPFYYAEIMSFSKNMARVRFFYDGQYVNIPIEDMTVIDKKELKNCQKQSQLHNKRGAAGQPASICLSQHNPWLAWQSQQTAAKTSTLLHSTTTLQGEN